MLLCQVDVPTVLLLRSLSAFLPCDVVKIISDCFYKLPSDTCPEETEATDYCTYIPFMATDTWEARTRLGKFEANTFAESPFLTNLASFVRGAVVCKERPPEILLAGKTKANGMASLSPEVQARLEIVKKESSAMGSLSPNGITTASGVRHKTSVVDEEGRIDWTCLATSLDAEEGDERALVEGARLAVSCHSWLRGKFQREPYFQFQMETLRGIPFLAEWILRGSDEEAYVALCICFTVLEKALFDIHHEGKSKRYPGDEPGWPGGSFSTEPTVVQGEDKDGRNGGDFAGGSSSSDVGVDGPNIVILRDLITSPVVKAALPDEMLAVLRLLLLPLGFNIRNLVVSLQGVRQQTVSQGTCCTSHDGHAPLFQRVYAYWAKSN